MTVKIWNFFPREALYECYQCARCTGSCPALEVAAALGPRETSLKCLNLGHDEVVEDERLWVCCTCNVCEDRCPQKIPISDLLVALRNSAARRGNIPDKLQIAIELLAKTGRSMKKLWRSSWRSRSRTGPTGWCRSGRRASVRRSRTRRLSA